MDSHGLDTALDIIVTDVRGLVYQKYHIDNSTMIKDFAGEYAAKARIRVDDFVFYNPRDGTFIDALSNKYYRDIGLIHGDDLIAVRRGYGKSEVSQIVRINCYDPDLTKLRAFDYDDIFDHDDISRVQQKEANKRLLNDIVIQKFNNIVTASCYHQKVMDIELRRESLGWHYGAEDIPSSYWTEKGFDDNYADAMNVFIQQNKRIVQSLRGGKSPVLFPHPIVIGVPGLTQGFVLQHDNKLLSHWRELAGAIKQYSKYKYRGEDYGLFELVFCRVQLGTPVLDILRDPLRNLHFSKLTFRNNFLTEHEDILSLKNLLEAHHSIKNLRWEENMFSHTNVMMYLCGIIGSIRGSCLKISSSFDGNNPTMIMTLLSSLRPNIKMLRLINNDMGLLGMTAFASGLNNSSLRNLQILKIIDNPLDDATCEMFARALQNNKNLVHVDIRGCEISSTGRSTMLNVVFDTTTFDSLLASNHICSIRGLNPCIRGFNNFVTPVHNRALKLFSAIVASQETDEKFGMNLFDGVQGYIPYFMIFAMNFHHRSSWMESIYINRYRGQATQPASPNFQDVHINGVGGIYQLTALYLITRNYDCVLESKKRNIGKISK